MTVRVGWGEGVVVGVVSSGEVFLCKLYGQRLWLVLGCVFFFGFRVVGLLRVFCGDCYFAKQIMR